ncbi:MAG: hypothetical protein WAN87_04625 [Thermoplasmata archaeon]
MLVDADECHYIELPVREWKTAGSSLKELDVSFNLMRGFEFWVESAKSYPRRGGHH